MGNVDKAVKQVVKERTRLAKELHGVTAALSAFGKVIIGGTPKKIAVPKRKNRTISAASRKKTAPAQGAKRTKVRAQKKSAEPKSTTSQGKIQKHPRPSIKAAR